MFSRAWNNQLSIVIDVGDAKSVLVGFYIFYLIDINNFFIEAIGTPKMRWVYLLVAHRLLLDYLTKLIIQS